MAVDALEAFVARAEAEHGAVLTSAPLSTEFAERAVRHAIGAVVDAAAREPEVGGMATTLSMLLILGGRGVVGHVGDSRIYRIRDRRLSQLTIDHDQSRALASDVWTTAGSDAPGPLVDTFAVDLEPDDLYVLCTDGALAALSDRGIARYAAEVSPRVLASRIVSLAHRRTPRTDATAVVVHVRGPRGSSSVGLSLRPLRASFGHALAAGAPRPRDDGEEQVEERDIEPPAARERSTGAVPRPRHAPTREPEPPDAGGGGRRRRTR